MQKVITLIAVLALGGCIQVYLAAPQSDGQSGTNATDQAEYRMAQVSVGIISTCVSSYDKVPVDVQSNTIPVLSGNKTGKKETK